MILGFGGFSILLAVLHNSVRKYIFHDEHNLDTTFDAGGNVSLSLTAVTVASQLFWPGDILHSATLTTKVRERERERERERALKTSIFFYKSLLKKELLQPGYL